MRISEFQNIKVGNHRVENASDILSKGKFGRVWTNLTNRIIGGPPKLTKKDAQFVIKQALYEINTSDIEDIKYILKTV